MINIVIPMAGLGSRFKSEEYKKPKPFIDVNGIPMIERVIENLKCDKARYILIMRKEHVADELEYIKYIKNKYNVEIIYIDNVTEGAACTVLYARKYINNDEPLLIANSDQIVDINICDFINDCFERKIDGSILTFKDPTKNEKWSFAKIDKNNLVEQVKEKVAISENATVGIYFYLRGKDFVNNSIDMIVRNDRVNNEFYVCPVYNYAISNGLDIGIYNIDYLKMHGIGTPEDLENYLDIIK